MYSKLTFNHDDPIRKLLAPINQSSYLICFCYNFFEIAKEINTYEVKSSRLGSQILTCFIFLDLFKKKHYNKAILLKKCQFRKNQIVLLQMTLDSFRLVFINVKCGNLIKINDGGQLTITINLKMKSGILLQPIDVYSMANVVGKSIYLETMWNI